jgi:FlaA1/EpsC-like NDP-sugar epimerase
MYDLTIFYGKIYLLSGFYCLIYKFISGESVMKKVISSLILIAISAGCFYFAFQEGTTSTLGIPLAVIGLVTLLIGVYKSKCCGIMEYILNLFSF